MKITGKIEINTDRPEPVEEKVEAVLYDNMGILLVRVSLKKDRWSDTYSGSAIVPRRGRIACAMFVRTGKPPVFTLAFEHYQHSGTGLVMTNLEIDEGQDIHLTSVCIKENKRDRADY